MLRGRGSNGWIGPRIIFLVIGASVSTLTWDLDSWLRIVIISAVTFLASRMDRWEWEGMLHYMNLWRAVAEGRPASVGIIIEEVTDDAKGQG